MGWDKKMSDEQIYNQRISKINKLIEEQYNLEEIFNALKFAILWDESEERLGEFIKSDLNLEWIDENWIKSNKDIQGINEINIQKDIIQGNRKKGPGRPKNEPVSYMTQKQYEDLKGILNSINTKLEDHTKTISELKCTVEALNKNNPYKELSEQTNKFFDIFISESAKKSIYINTKLVEQVKDIMSKKMKKHANTSNIINAALLDVALRNKEKQT
jgi:hypothetical protein